MYILENIPKILLFLYIVLYIFKGKINLNLCYFIISTLILAGVISLRDYTTAGVDLIRYEYSYEYAKSLSFSDALNIREGANIGYFLLNYLCASNGIPYQLYVSGISLFCVLSSTFFFYRNNSSNYFSLMMYLGFGVYFFQFSGIKQSISMALILLVYHLWINEKRKMSLILYITAIAFHPVALVVVPFLVLSSIQIKRIHIFISVIFFLVLFVLRMEIGALLTAIYSDSYVGRYESSGRVGGTFIVIFSILVLYIYMMRNRRCYNETKHKNQLILICICCCFQLLSSSSYAFTRLNLFYVQFLPIIVDSIISELKFNTLLVKCIGMSLLIAIVIVLNDIYYDKIEGDNLSGYQMITNF